MKPPAASAYRFFRKHGGSRVGFHAVDALALARAEALLDEAEDLCLARTRWEEEPYWHVDDMGDDGDVVARRIEAGALTGPFVCLVETFDAESFGSLGMVVLDGRGPDGDPYARVVRAEIASEIVDDLRTLVTLGNFPVGSRVELAHDVDRYPHFLAPAGARGTVVDMGDPEIFAVRLDHILDGAQEWCNEVHWIIQNGDDPRRDLRLLSGANDEVLP